MALGLVPRTVKSQSKQCSLESQWLTQSQPSRGSWITQEERSWHPGLHSEMFSLKKKNEGKKNKGKLRDFLASFSSLSSYALLQVSVHLFTPLLLWFKNCFPPILFYVLILFSSSLLINRVTHDLFESKTSIGKVETGFDLCPVSWCHSHIWTWRYLVRWDGLSGSWVIRTKLIRAARMAQQTKVLATQ